MVRKGIESVVLGRREVPDEHKISGIPIRVDDGDLRDM